VLPPLVEIDAAQACHEPLRHESPAPFRRPVPGSAPPWTSCATA